MTLSDVSIRPERSGDETTIYEVNRLAFGRESEPKLVDALRASDCFIPELSLVAEQTGRIVAHVLFSRATIRTTGGEIPVLVLGPVAVLPECQNRGIGSQLIEAGLEDAREMGERIVVLIGHPWYYPRFGFKPARPLGIEYPTPIRDEVFMVLELTPDALDDIHGTLALPPAFADV
ncbi:MAG: N-acetyltransferase [Nitrolancea sp.]